MDLDSKQNDRHADKDLFKSEKIESAVDRVINAIKEALIAGKLLPGEKLPSEAELSQRFSISRGSIREAMKILSAFGIVEVRRGDGTYVASSERKPVFDPLLFSLILSRANMKELVELRELMEVIIVKLIIKNAGVEDLKNIEHTIIEMENLDLKGNENHTEEFTKLDIAFHHALGLSTKNKLVEKIYNFVIEYFTPSIRIAIKKRSEKGLNARSIEDHKKIYRTLTGRNVEEAVNTVEKDMKKWRNLISKGPLN